MKHTLRALAAAATASMQGADEEADRRRATKKCSAIRARAAPSCARRRTDGHDQWPWKPFEYAIKKDVRNNPIVREVDEARQRELWKSVGVAGFLVLVLLFSAWQHFELLRHGYQIEELQRAARGRGRNRPPAAARDRNAEVAQADRGAGHRSAAPRRAVARRSDRHRTRAAGRAAGQVGRRAAVMTTPVAAAPARLARRPLKLARCCAALVVALALGLWVAGIEARLVYLQVFDRADLVARAERQQERTQPSPAKRGDILDRRGRVLATSVDADTIYAVPVGNRRRAATRAKRSARRSATARPRNGRRWSSGSAARSAFAYVRRQVVAGAGAARRGARISTASASSRRAGASIPNKELAAHLLGYVGIDNTGLSGLEYTYDPQIRGKAGTICPDRRAAPCVQPLRAAADLRVDRRADDRRVPAAHRRARAARRRRSRTARRAAPPSS